MAKAPEVRIKVYDVDRLMRLTDPQLRVWLYYKRREGKDGKAFGKAATIGGWAGLEPGTVRNNRSWLTRNGWLKPNGKSKSGLPMFLAVIPQLQPEESECHSTVIEASLPSDSGVIAQLHQVSLGSETEVTTLKYQPEEATLKDSALTSGKEGRKEQASPSSPDQQEENRVGNGYEREQATEETDTLQEAWTSQGGKPFRYSDDGIMDEVRDAKNLIDRHGLEAVLSYVHDTFACLKTAKVAWRDFSYWAAEDNLDLTRRNINAWRRTKKKPAAPEAKPTNPNCCRCKGPTYGSPAWEDDKPYCAECMKLPLYRRHSGERSILSASDI